MTNPATTQSSPPVTVSATLANTIGTIAEAVMTKPGALMYGVAYDSDPLTVLECPEYSHLIVGSVVCEYNTGFYGDGTLFCEACPKNTGSLPGVSSVTDCKCNAGFYGDETSNCEPCQAGMYQNIVGASTCKPCPKHSSSTAERTACLCETGFYGYGTSECQE